MARAADFDPTTLDGVNRAVVGIDGLWCPSCAAAVGRAISAIPGVTHAQVSFAGSSAALAWAPGTELGGIARQVAGMGYRLTAPTEASEIEGRIGAERLASPYASPSRSRSACGRWCSRSCSISTPRASPMAR